MGTTIAIVLFVSTGAVTALKGHWLLFAVGLLIGPAVWVLGFLVPARPRSWWFAHVYDDRRRADAARKAERIEPTRLFRRR